MRIAIIDMGTNTFHLLAVDVIADGYNVIYQEKVAVRLGKGGISEGKITPEAFQRALDCLTDFKKKILENKVTDVFATATSAVRNANNGNELVNKIKEETGIEVNIISGLEEAELIYYGVSHALKIGNKPSLIMDIGGGSIEFIIGTDDEILWMNSFEIGGQRLMDLFQKNDPITSEEIEEIRNHLAKELVELQLACEKHQPFTLIGSSGTFDTLSHIFKRKEKHKRKLSATEYLLTTSGFLSIYEMLVTEDRNGRMKIPGMIELRVDMIVVASVLIKYILDITKIKSMRVSAYALREGVLLNTINRLSS